VSRIKKPYGKGDLLKELQDIAKRPAAPEDHKVFAVALAYIVNDICPDDRTSAHVFRRRKEAETT